MFKAIFKERYLIQKSSGRLGKVVSAVTDLSKSPVEIAETVTHNNEDSGPWNSEQIAMEKEAYVNIKEEMTTVRKKLKKVFWNLPGEMIKGLLSSLNSITIAPLVVATSKVIQPVQHTAELAVSGALVAARETWNAIKYPLRLLKRLHARIKKALEEEGGGGHGPTPAHGH